MPENYKRISCIIDDRDCDDANTCDDCYIAIEEIQRRQEEIDVKYKIDMSVELGNRKYYGNHRRTVIKAEIDDLEYIKNIFKLENPKEITGSEYI